MYIKETFQHFCKEVSQNVDEIIKMRKNTSPEVYFIQKHFTC